MTRASQNLSTSENITYARSSYFKFPTNMNSCLFQLYVASCMDLTLRVFTEHFELIKVIEFAATVLSFVFDDETSMLYLGGLGYIQVWSVKHSLQDAITFGMEISCSINDRQVSVHVLLTLSLKYYHPEDNFPKLGS